MTRITHGRIFLLAICLGMVLMPALGQAQQVRTLRYPYEAVWSAAIRLIRVDHGYRISDRDKENGFILFVYPGKGAVKDCPASLELVDLSDPEKKRAEVRLALRIADQPAYIAVAFLDRLERKIESERGRPADSEERRTPPFRRPSQDDDTAEDKHRKEGP